LTLCICVCGSFRPFSHVILVLKSILFYFSSDEVFHTSVLRFFSRDNYPFFSWGSFFISVICQISGCRFKKWFRRSDPFHCVCRRHYSFIYLLFYAITTANIQVLGTPIPRHGRRSGRFSRLRINSGSSLRILLGIKLACFNWSSLIYCHAKSSGDS